MKAKLLPAKIFAKREEDGNESFLVAEENLNSLKEEGIDIGVYEITSVKRFKLVEEKGKPK